MMDGLSLWAQWEYDRELVARALEDARKSAKEAAKAEAAYYRAKHKRALELRLDGEPMTYIAASIKGDPDVVYLLEERIRATELHKVDMRAIDVYREDTRMVYDQIRKEQESL